MYAHDIPLGLAQAAHAGTSMVPERRAQQVQHDYAATLEADHAALERYATTDEQRALLAEEFAQYRHGYRRHVLTWLSARSCCLSVLVTGPSNFPSRRNDKATERERRLSEGAEAFRGRALAAIRKRLTPELQPILSSDDDAGERLQAKIAKAERLQEAMRAANAAIRKHAKAGPDAQVAALVAIGHPEAVARALLEKDFAGRVGFAGYLLTNNAANIRRMKQRAVGVARDQATASTSTEGARATIEDDPPANRVRLFFPGKPEAGVRSGLKARGFRWAPTLGCWQAYRNAGSLAHAREVAGAPA